MLGKNQHKNIYFDGLEIGAVSVKFVQKSSEGNLNYEVKRHGGNPSEIIHELLEKYEEDDSFKIVVTGEAAKKILNLPYYSEVECLEKAISYLKIKPDILLSLGGESFTIYPMKDGIIKNILSTSKCQAGSGEFLVQQFQRMGFSIDDGIEASKTGKIVKLATRCSVHCKSDATHKLNKGECQKSDIAKTLIFDLAKKVSEMIDLAQWPKKSIVLAGNVTNNDPFVQNLKNFLNESEISVLKESNYLESFGAALIASDLPDSDAIQYNDRIFKESTKKFNILPPLHLSETLLDFRVKEKFEIHLKEGGTYILGVDAGSTTTKAILLNLDDGSIGAQIYLRTLGNPIQATKQCLNALIDQVGDKKIKIIQCSVTGSAREMVSVYLDNCLTFNEILAHGRAAIEEIPDVDTVFEIGGQDSKFISFQGGIPVDYAMNDGCSAGTGSFLEESASVDMGVSVTKIGDIALKSDKPIAFGERCAAFINTDLRNALQQNGQQEDVIAGLVYSIADNYISRIVGPRYLGETILFLGGVALNKAVGMAIASRLKRKVVVPSHPELMGAVGSALMARDRLNDGDIKRDSYNLAQLAEGQMEIKGTFKCSACENNCEIQTIAIRGKTLPFGGLCSKYWLQRNKYKAKKEINDGQDFIAIRNDLMFKEFGTIEIKNPRGKIGIPLSLIAYEVFPFYAKLINELGYEVVLSKYSKENQNLKRDVKAPICYPCEIVHVGVRELIEKDVDFIFIPYIIEMEISEGYLHGYSCASTTTLPGVISASFEDYTDKFLSPHFSFSKGSTKANIKEIERLCSKLGIKKSRAKMAVIKALNHYRNFKRKYREVSESELENLLKKPTVVLAGRPYVTMSSEINLALPRKITSRAFNVIPMDFLPPITGQGIHKRNAWHFSQQINNAVMHVKENPNLYICFVSCFSCGPDATMLAHFRQQLQGITFCYLEIDSHTAHAGFETRVGAFLDIIEERRRKVDL